MIDGTFKLDPRLEAAEGLIRQLEAARKRPSKVQ